MTIKKVKIIQTVEVSYEDFVDIDFKPPSNYFIRLATGDYLFYRSRDREAIQQQVNKDFDNRYQVRKV